MPRGGKNPHLYWAQRIVNLNVVTGTPAMVELLDTLEADLGFNLSNFTVLRLLVEGRWVLPAGGSEAVNVRCTVAIAFYPDTIDVADIMNPTVDHYDYLWASSRTLDFLNPVAGEPTIGSPLSHSVWYQDLRAKRTQRQNNQLLQFTAFSDSAETTNAQFFVRTLLYVP